METFLDISKRANRITVSQTVNIASKAILMKRQNIDVIDLSVGEPDFPTPNHIKAAAKKAIDDDLTKYTLNSGIVELRQAIAQKLRDDYQLNYEIDEIIVSNGAKQCIINAILSLVNSGDEVLIPAPYWVSYPEMVKLAEGEPKIIQTKEQNGLKLSPDELQDSISDRTKALILCNPGNPTGLVYSREELEQLADIIESNHIYIIADEIYEKLTFDNLPFVSPAAISPQMKHNTVIVNGVSKAYAMTGWRIGYAAGNRKIIEAANRIQSHSTSNASTISQYASLEALTGPQDEIINMRSEFEKRRNYVFNRLNAIKDISCHKPAGAFYVFPNIAAFFGRSFNGQYINDSYEFCDYILQEAKVTVIPGTAFGSDDHIRISYATSMHNLEKGMNRLEQVLAKLQ
jgi:aspartate/methionine/tyrosine aminotransferase